MTPKTKKWYTSKLLWSLVLLVLIGAGELAVVFLESGDYSPAAIAAFIVGILGVIFRIGFTDTKLVK